MPFQAALRTHDPQVDLIGAAAGHLGEPVCTVCTVVVFQNDVVVQIQLFAERIRGGQQALDLQAGNIVDQMLHMRAIIRAGVGNAAVLGIGAPDTAVDLFLLGKQIEEAVLDVVGVDCDDLANITAGDHLLHHLAHDIAGIAVVHCKYQILFPGDPRQILRLFHSQRQGLFAYYIDAMLQEGLGCGVMNEVWRADRDKVDLAGFGLSHRFCIVIHAGLVNVIRFCAFVVQIVVRREAAAYQLCTRVQSQRLAMALTDQSLEVAAYHTISHLIRHFRILLNIIFLFGCYSYLIRSNKRFAAGKPASVSPSGKYSKQIVPSKPLSCMAGSRKSKLISPVPGSCRSGTSAI